MTLRFLFDTNVVSELMRPSPDAQLLARAEPVMGQAAVAAVTWYELRFGVERLPSSRRRSALSAHLDAIEQVLEVVPYDADAAAWQASECARLASRGRTIPMADAQIAAVAATRSLVLVTRNTRDFASCRGLRVERWHA